MWTKFTYRSKNTFCRANKIKLFDPLSHNYNDTCGFFGEQQNMLGGISTFSSVAFIVLACLSSSDSHDDGTRLRDETSD